MKRKDIVTANKINQKLQNVEDSIERAKEIRNMLRQEVYELSFFRIDFIDSNKIDQNRLNKSEATYPQILQMLNMDKIRNALLDFIETSLKVLNNRKQDLLTELEAL